MWIKEINPLLTGTCDVTDIKEHRESTTHTWVHLITVEVGTALAAADTREGGNGIPVAIAVTAKKKSHLLLEEHICPGLYTVWWQERAVKAKYEQNTGI